MEYPAEFHTGLITVSSIFMAIGGIIAAVVASREDIARQLGRHSIRLVLASILFGVPCVVFALVWFAAPSEGPTTMAIIFLVFQSVFMFAPLWRLINSLTKR